MAISDYLTNDEWDGCYYVFMSQNQLNFSEVIRSVVPALYEKGYQVQGLGRDCSRIQYGWGGNAKKLVAAMCGTGDADLRACVINGRNFIKQHLPELLRETDEQWEAWLKETEPEELPKTSTNDKPRKRSKA